MPRPYLLPSVLLAATIVGAACRDVSAPIEDPATATYASALHVDIKQMKQTSSGLYYQDLVVGTGKPATKDSIAKVYYTGWLSSGQSFDALQSGTPFSFVVGTGGVIKGWDEGILAGEPMRQGGKRRLVIPPSLGYGGHTQGKIPAGSVLVFDISLIGVGAGT